MRRLPLFTWWAVLALAAGCARDAPTVPVAGEIESPMPAAHLAITPEAAAAFRIAVDDAVTRILPAIGDPAAAGRIHDALVRLDRGIVERDGRAVLLAIREAERAIVPGNEGARPGAADVDALGLVLVLGTEIAHGVARDAAPSTNNF